MLEGATSWICVLPLAVALSVALTAGSTSHVTFTFSAASSAASCDSAITIATGSPTQRAASLASGMCGGTLSSGSSHPHGSEFTPVMSLPVKIATTPGCLRAAAVSIFLMRACACGLRTNAAHVVPGSFTSSTYVPRPVMKRGSSRRLIDLPSTRSTVAMMLSYFFPAICSAAHWIALTMLW